MPCHAVPCHTVLPSPVPLLLTVVLRLHLAQAQCLEIPLGPALGHRPGQGGRNTRRIWAHGHIVLKCQACLVLETIENQGFMEMPQGTEHRRGTQLYGEWCFLDACGSQAAVT